MAYLLPFASVGIRAQKAISQVQTGCVSHEGSVLSSEQTSPQQEVKADMSVLGFM